MGFLSSSVRGGGDPETQNPEDEMARAAARAGNGGKGASPEDEVPDDRCGCSDFFACYVGSAPAGGAGSASVPRELRAAICTTALSSIGIGWALVQLNVETGDSNAMGTLVMSTTDVTVCSAVLFFTAGFAALLCNGPTERYGRRISLLAADVLFVVGALLCAATPDFRAIFVGRALIGLGCGTALTVVPVLLTEISPPSQRGMIGVVHTICITFGAWLCAFVGWCAVCHYWAGWRLVAAGLGCPAALQVVLAARYLPESPRWLLDHRDGEAALAQLRSLRKAGTPDEQLWAELAPQPAGTPPLAERVPSGQAAAAPGGAAVAAMPTRRTTKPPRSVRAGHAAPGTRGTLGGEPYVIGHESDDDNDSVSSAPNSANGSRASADARDGPDALAGATSVSWAELESLRVPIVIGLALLMLQAASGINVIMSYSTSIFKSAGVNISILATVIATSVCMVATMACAVLVDSFGRRTLLLVSCYVMAVAAAAVGLTLSAAESSNLPPELTSTVAIAGICVFYLGYALGMGPVPWVLAAEIFEHRLRARALAALSAANLWVNGLLVCGSLYLINAFAGCELDATVHDDDHTSGCTEGDREHGAGLLLCCFAGVCLLTALFVHGWVVETKGLSLEQLERTYSSRRHLLHKMDACCVPGLCVRPQGGDVVHGHGADSPLRQPLLPSPPLIDAGGACDTPIC